MSAAQPNTGHSVEFCLGYDAALFGYGDGDNPFAAQCDAHADWAAGWQASMDDDAAENDPEGEDA